MCRSQLQEAVGLLERQDKAYGTCNASDWYIEHYPLVEDIEAFLARIRAGSDKENKS